MVKTYVLDQLLVEWSIKSLFPSITKNVAKCKVVTEEKVITRAQYLDLIYTQYGTLCENIKYALIPSNIVPHTPGKESHAIDGIIGSASS